MNYIEEVIKLSKEALAQNEVPIAAIIVKDGVIIGKGYNLKNKDNNVLAHAELIAIQNAQNYLNDWRLNDCDIYVSLEPCPMCASAIQQSRISNVYYLVESSYDINHKIIDLIFSNSTNNNKVSYHFTCNSEMNDIISDFFKNKR